MAMNEPMFEIKLKKISFKQAPTSQHVITCNLLHSKFFSHVDNRKLDNTDPFQIPANQKSIDLSSLKSLLFNVKEEENKLPILVYILYGEESAKKIILKRTEMMKKYDLEQKDQFQFQQNFGLFSIFYQVKVRKQDVSKKETRKNDENSTSSDVKSFVKNDQVLTRSFKRPTLLEVGEKAEKIRKNSIDQKEAAQIHVGNQTKDVNSKLQIINSKELTNSHTPLLTLVKDQKTEENLVKKDLKINLFENFQTIDKKPIEHDDTSEIKVQSLNGSINHSKAHSVQGSHHSSKNSNGQNHKDHHDAHDGHGKHHEHDSHGDHHGDHHSHGNHDDQDEHSESMSLKLKTVVVMLIVGFLFLMYDALDDRFSRKIRKLEPVHGHGEDHGHELDSHGTQSKKKKTGKKAKKVSTH